MIAIKLCPVSVAVSIMMMQVFGSALAGYCLSGEQLTCLEILSIIGGFCGVLVLTNHTLLSDKGDPELQRHVQDQKDYPYYYFGIASAFIYCLFSVFNFYEMRRMGKGVHSSIKTFYFGVCCVLFTLAYIAYDGPEFFYFHLIGTDDYPINLEQLLASLAVGFFSWANQESLSLCLTIVKQGTASAFNNIALIVAFRVDAFYFQRHVFTLDIVGTSMIIVFGISQCLLSDSATKKEATERRKTKELIN